MSSELDGSTEVISIASNGKAFAAIRSDGSVITWGYLHGGGDSSSVSSELDGSIDVISITGTAGITNFAAFAAIRSDGSVITWGRPDYGGDSSSVSTELDGTIDVVSIAGTDKAFAAALAAVRAAAAAHA